MPFQEALMTGLGTGIAGKMIGAIPGKKEFVKGPAQQGRDVSHIALDLRVK